MTPVSTQAENPTDAAAATGEDHSLRRAVFWLSGGAVVLMGLAGGLLWWRDGERLFTEGLISAIARCF
jgi:hypothetical protein